MRELSYALHLLLGNELIFTFNTFQFHSFMFRHHHTKNLNTCLLYFSVCILFLLRLSVARLLDSSSSCPWSFTTTYDDNNNTLTMSNVTASSLRNVQKIVQGSKQMEVREEEKSRE